MDIRSAKVLIKIQLELMMMMLLILPLFAIPEAADGSQVKHVLLSSVDGLHQSDLKWYVNNHPGSELAKLVHGGAEFTNAHTAVPSDSDPGATALMTGGDNPSDRDVPILLHALGMARPN